MKRIESSSNEMFRSFLSLIESKGIKKEKQFLVYGKNPIHDILQSSHEHVQYVISTQESADEAHRLHRSLPIGADVIFLSKNLFEELNIFGIDYPILVCKSPQWEDWTPGKNARPTVICPFGNPINIGNALRSALAFDFDVVVTKESAHPLHPRSLRALSGNIFAQKIYLSDSIKNLTGHPKMVVVDKNGSDISKYEFKENSIFVVGEEGQGIPATLESLPRVSIPIHSSQESLNAGVALAIAAFQYRVQFKMSYA